MRSDLKSDSVIKIYGAVSKIYAEDWIKLKVKQFDFKFGAGYQLNSIKTGSVIDFSKVKYNDSSFVSELKEKYASNE